MKYLWRVWYALPVWAWPLLCGLGLHEWHHFNLGELDRPGGTPTGRRVSFRCCVRCEKTVQQGVS